MNRRVFDITAALLLGLLCLPILLLAIFAILLLDGRPVLFVQWRMGRGFKPFLIYKLRTMRVHAAGSAVTLGKDARITRTGRWLRRFKIDELPQLWNILRGEMSVIGPRPMIPAIALEFVESYNELLAVRPGLSDPASIKYCRENDILQEVALPLDYFKTVITPDKLRLSRAYIKQASLTSDLWLLFATTRAVLLPLLDPLHILSAGCFARFREAAAILPRMDWREELQPVYLPRSTSQPSSFSARQRAELWADSPRASSRSRHQVYGGL